MEEERESHQTAAHALLELYGARKDAVIFQQDGARPKTVRVDNPARVSAATGNHISGRYRVGCYLLTDGKSRLVAIDLDAHGPGQLAAPQAAAQQLVEHIKKRAGLSGIIEKTKTAPGARVTYFFRSAEPASTTRPFFRKLMAEAGLPANVELFPKQDSENMTTGHLGSALWLPYYGKDVAAGLTVFRSDDRDLTLDEALETIEGLKISSMQLRRAIKLVGAESLADASGKGVSASATMTRSSLGSENGNVSLDRPQTALACAMAAGISASWTKGNRHKLVLGICGAMAKNGFTGATAKRGLELVLSPIDDAEVKSRSSEWDRIIIDTFNKPAASLAGWTTLEQLGVNTVAIRTAAGVLAGRNANAAEASEQWIPQPIRDFLQSVKTDQIPWIIDRLVPPADVTILVAPPKAGKTTLILHMALSVATGTVFAGRFKSKQAPVLLILEEDRSEEVRSRLRALAAGINQPLENLPLLLLVRRRWRLDTEAGRSWLADVVAKHSPALVAVDPLSRVHGLQENNRDQMSAMLNALPPLLEPTQTGIVIAHHVRKMPAAELEAAGVNAVRGSGDLVALARSIITVHRDDEKWRIRVDGNYDPPSPFVLTLDREDESAWRVTFSGWAEDKDQADTIRCILEALSVNPKGLKTDELVKRVGKRRQDVLRILDELKNDGQISEESIVEPNAAGYRRTAKLWRLVRATNAAPTAAPNVFDGDFDALLASKNQGSVADDDALLREIEQLPSPEPKPRPPE